MSVNATSLYSLIFSVALLSGCKAGPNATKMQYMPDMADAPTVKAQENYLDPPEHSVTINAILYPTTLEAAEVELRNPFGESAAMSQEFKAKGKKLYETYCHVCHGYQGDGKGTMGDAYPMPVPNLLRAELLPKKDGFYFHMISKGRGLMPAYADKISPHERWWIVAHIHELQQAAGGAAVVPNGQAPGQGGQEPLSNPPQNQQ